MGIRLLRCSSQSSKIRDPSWKRGGSLNQQFTPFLNLTLLRISAVHLVEETHGSLGLCVSFP